MEKLSEFEVIEQNEMFQIDGGATADWDWGLNTSGVAYTYDDESDTHSWSVGLLVGVLSVEW